MLSTKLNCAVLPSATHKVPKTCSTAQCMLVWKYRKDHESTAINRNEFEKWLPNECVYLFVSIRFKCIQPFVVQTCECKLIKCIYCRHSTAGNYFMIKGTCVRVKCILSWSNSYNVVHETVSITTWHILVLRRQSIWGFEMQQSIYMNNAVGKCYANYDGLVNLPAIPDVQISFKKYRINFPQLVVKENFRIVFDLIQMKKRSEKKN